MNDHTQPEDQVQGDDRAERRPGEVNAGLMSLRARSGGTRQARAWVTASTLTRERDVWRRAYSAVRRMTIRVDVT